MNIPETLIITDHAVRRFKERSGSQYDNEREVTDIISRLVREGSIVSTRKEQYGGMDIDLMMVEFLVKLSKETTVLYALVEKAEEEFVVTTVGTPKFYRDWLKRGSHTHRPRRSKKPSKPWRKRNKR